MIRIVTVATNFGPRTVVVRDDLSPLLDGNEKIIEQAVRENYRKGTYQRIWRRMCFIGEAA